MPADGGGRLVGCEYGRGRGLALRSSAGPSEMLSCCLVLYSYLPVYRQVPGGGWVGNRVGGGGEGARKFRSMPGSGSVSTPSRGNLPWAVFFMMPTGASSRRRLRPRVNKSDTARVQHSFMYEVVNNRQTPFLTADVTAVGVCCCRCVLCVSFESSVVVQYKQIEWRS